MIVGQQKDTVSYVLLRVVYKMMELDKTVRKYGTNSNIHVSEIHMIQQIHELGGAYMMEIARNLGITRGAVSQIIAKLVKKGLIRKVDDPENKLRRVPVLTEKGKTAYEYHEMYHRRFNYRVDAVLDSEKPEEMETIRNFLLRVEQIADDMGKQDGPAE